MILSPTLMVKYRPARDLPYLAFLELDDEPAHQWGAGGKTQDEAIFNLLDHLARELLEAQS